MIILPEDVAISRLTKLITSLRNPDITRSFIILFRLFSNSSELLNCLNNRMFPQRTTSNTNTMKTLFRTVLSTIVLSRFSYFTKLYKCFKFVLKYLLMFPVILKKTKWHLTTSTHKRVSNILILVRFICLLYHNIIVILLMSASADAILTVHFNI